MKDGTLVRAHLEAAEKARPGMARGMLDKADPPAGTGLIWSWYLDISTARQHSMSGPLPIPFSELHAWCALHDIHLEPWQLRAIRLLDMHNLAALAVSGEETLENVMKPREK